MCSLSDLTFPQPLNEPSVVHVAACIVAAFDQFHSRCILFRGLDPSTIAVDTNGLAQLVDSRYVQLPVVSTQVAVLSEELLVLQIAIPGLQCCVCLTDS